jgi:hypothetical protein
MILTISLLGVALAITGLMAFAFFWPMTLVHLRDRHSEVHVRLGAITIVGMSWLLAGRYRDLHDPALDGLAIPARIALVALLIGAGCALGFALLAWATKP